jgi:ATP-dependent DNA ligase
MGDEESFVNRFYALQIDTMIRSTFDNEYLYLVETTVVEDQAHLDELNASYLGDGYEGQIIRIDGQPYQNKRSKYLLKRKEFTDQEFTIVRIVEGLGNRSGMAGSIEYLTDDGIEFSSGIAGGFEFYKMLWENQDKYIGGQGNVRFFNWTEYGRPYLPVTHDVYEGKREI